MKEFITKEAALEACSGSHSREEVGERIRKIQPVIPPKITSYLVEEYEKAKTLEFVYNPVGYALYQTWKKWG